MRKAVAVTTGVIVVGVAGWLGATWYTGKRIESESGARLREANEQLAQALPGYGLKIEQLDFQRGFFASRARYGITMTGAAARDALALPPGVLEVNASIEHGPYTRGALARGDVLPRLAFVHAELAQTEALKPLYTLTQGAVPLWSDTVLHYGGDASGRAAVAPMQGEHDGMRATFSGATLESVYTRSNQGVKGTLRADSLVVESNDDADIRRAALTGLVLDMDTRMGRSGLSIGTTGLSAQRLELEGPGGQFQVALEAPAYTVKLDETDGRLHGDAVYRIGKLSVGDADFGGGEAIVKLANLDGKAVRQLMESYGRFADAVMTEADGQASAPGKRDALLRQALDDARGLLAAGPSVSLDPLRWTTAKGESRLTLALTLAAPQADAAASVRELARQLIKSLDARAIVSRPMAQDMAARILAASQGLAPEDAARQAEEQVAGAAGMAQMLNLARQEGDDLVAEFRYADGRAALNGREIPVEELFAGLPDRPMGALSQDEDDDAPAAQPSELLGQLDGKTLGDIVREAGFEFDTSTSDDGSPLLVLKPAESGASDIRVEFNGCDIEDACDNAMLRAAFETPTPVPLQALNAWNRENRWTRAYLDEDDTPMLEMDINAYGGIGREGAEAFVHTFLDTVPEFAAMLRQAKPAPTPAGK